MLESNGITKDGARWLRKVERDTLAAIEEQGEIAGAQLSKFVPALRAQLTFGEGKKWGATVGVSTRVMFLLATEQRVARGRPNGTWTSSQYRWSPMDAWVDDAAPTPTPVDARTALARRWLAAFGPGTTDDLKWWTGWSLGHTRAALTALDAVEVELDHGTGWVLPDDVAPVRAPKPWVALLPALDPTTMGWQERDWYLGLHRKALFDRNGNAGPTVWVDGRIVGGWAQRRDGRVVHELLEDVGRAASSAIERAAADLEAFFGAVRVTPRFPTPLQQELAAR
jgi:hypothetical protein